MRALPAPSAKCARSIAPPRLGYEKTDLFQKRTAARYALAAKASPFEKTPWSPQDSRCGKAHPKVPQNLA